MRTNIEIDDRLIREATRRSGAPRKRAAVEAGLRLLAEAHAQGSIRRLRGKVDGGAISVNRGGPENNASGPAPLLAKSAKNGSPALRPPPSFAQRP